MRPGPTGSYPIARNKEGVPISSVVTPAVMLIEFLEHMFWMVDSEDSEDLHRRHPASKSKQRIPRDVLFFEVA
jgi:hypothetical protein